MKSDATTFSLRKAALIAGFGLLIMVLTTPYAELYAYPKLISPDNPAETIQNIRGHKTLFLLVILCYLVTFISDIIVAWALYLLLLPVNRYLSLLTAWFRLVYATISIVALTNLVKVFKLVNNPDYLSIMGQDVLEAQVKLGHSEFGYEWSFGFFFFAVYLGMLGYLVYSARYIPRIMGILLVLAGLGYLINELKPYFFPQFNLDFIMITFLGEVVFMLWLLIRGWKIPDQP